MQMSSYSPDPITDLTLKFSRAREHLDALENELKWWLANHPYRIVEEIDPQTGIKEIVVVADTPPVRFAVIAGDVVQNLRNSLDYIIGYLATTNSGGYLMPKVEQALQFPITTSKTNFRVERKRGRLGCVPPQAQALVHRLQPYRARNHAFAAHPLYVLQELSNVDKHRRLPLITAIIKGIRLNEMTMDGTVEVFNPAGPSAEKAVLVRMGPDAKVEMDLAPDAVALDITFGKGTPIPGAPLFQTLRDLTEWCERNILRTLPGMV